MKTLTVSISVSSAYICTSRQREYPGKFSESIPRIKLLYVAFVTICFNVGKRKGALCFMSNASSNRMENKIEIHHMGVTRIRRRVRNDKPDLVS